MFQSRLRNRRVSIRICHKTLTIMRGNFSCRRVVPFIERGPFGCWTASWSSFRVMWQLTRWL